LTFYFADSDGRISLDEFLDAQLFFKIEDSFKEVDGGDNSVLSDHELLNWLRKWAITDSDVTAMKGLTPADKALEIQSCGKKKYYPWSMNGQVCPAYRNARLFRRR
jgi:hypothetical protein